MLRVVGLIHDLENKIERCSVSNEVIEQLASWTIPSLLRVLSSLENEDTIFFPIAPASSPITFQAPTHTMEIVYNLKWKHDSSLTIYIGSRRLPKHPQHPLTRLESAYNPAGNPTFDAMNLNPTPTEGLLNNQLGNENLILPSRSNKHTLTR